MEHVYTPEEYLTIEHLQQELKQIEIESNPLPKKRPKAVTVNFILAYSNALEVKQLKKFGKIEQILN